MINFEYKIGDTVEMKKPHPCSTHSKLWKILELSGEVKIKCLGCGATVIMKRFDFDKRIVRVVNDKGN